MKAKEILERVEDRLRRLANDCAMASMPLEACLSTERTANMVNDSLDEVREALAALEAEGSGANIDAITQAIRDDEDGLISAAGWGWPSGADACRVLLIAADAAEEGK